MRPTRRDTILMAGATLAAGPAQAAGTVAETLAFLTGGAEPSAEGIALTLPAHFENGNSVPVTVASPGAETITLIATDNPNVEIATFAFGPMAGSRSVSTRIRLARSQEVIALATMPGGATRRTSAWVEVTIGGCGA